MRASFRTKIAGLGFAAALVIGGLAMVATPSAHAANVPLPAYPSVTTLNLGSPYCVTDDVIMNQPSTSLTVTAGSNGSPVVYSQDTLPVTYWMSYWDGTSPESNNANWKSISTLPIGSSSVSINPNTGVISAAGGSFNGSNTYTVRVSGQDSANAVGVDQFQLNVVGNGTTTTVSYGGNNSDNANADLTIGLNSNGTQLILNATNLGNPDAALGNGVTFQLYPSQPGWHITGAAPAGAVLTGDGVNDPEIEATTNNGDVVFFKLSGVSTDSGGNFYENGDVNPCVGEAPAPAPTPTGSTPPPVTNTAACTSAYGNEVNGFGNGLDAFKQGAFANNEIVGWPATQGDPATHFLCEPEGGNMRFEYAPHGTGTGLCVSNPGDNELVLRSCNANIWQRFTASGRYLVSALNGQFVEPEGTGVQLTTSSGHSPWGGDKYTWTSVSALP